MISVKAPEPSAEAFQVALNTAGSDPEMRLRMILGEAYQKYLALCRWIAREIESDESKAPGLGNLARACATNPARLDPTGAKWETHQHLLEEAIGLGTPVIEMNSEPAPAVKTIEHRIA